MKTVNYIKEHYLILSILLVAAILRFHHLDFQSAWMDEIYTLNVSNPNASFRTLISEVNLREGFPYLYFIIMKIMLGIFGYLPVIARAFSAIMGIAGVYMIYRFGKEMFSRNTGLMAAVLVAFSEYCIYISQDARPYTFYFFAVILSFYTMVRFIKNPTMHHSIVYGLSCGLLLNTNYFSFLNLFSQAIIVLAFLISCPKELRVPFLKKSFIAAAIGIALFLPNLPKFLTVLAFKSNWIPPPTNESVSLIFKEFLGNSEITLFIFMPLFIYFLFNLFKAKRGETYQEIIDSKKVFAFMVLAPWVIVFVFVAYAKSFTDTSVMISRYFTSILPVFFLIFAAGIAMIRNRIISYSVLLCTVLFMFTNNVAVRQYYRVPSKTQFREAANFVIDNNKNNEAVYTGLKYWFDYFFTNTTTKKFTLTEKPTFEAFVTEIQQDSTKIRPFWFIEAHARPYALSDAGEAFLDKHFFLESSYNGLDAWGRHYILKSDANTTVDIKKFDLSKPVNGNTFNYAVEGYENTGNQIKVNGWAYFDAQDAATTSVQLLLIGNGNGLRFQTQSINRPDISVYFKSKFKLDHAGFSSSISISDLGPGKYQVAILLTDSKTAKEGLIITDKFLQK